LPLERVTEATITDRNTLLADIDRGRKQGYFVTAGENVADVMAVAATVRLGSDVYGIAVAGPMHRMERALTAQASALAAACTAITEMLTVGRTQRRMGGSGAIDKLQSSQSMSGRTV
jgi:DNA-binding IclR family transcriptional regulator